MINMHSKYDNMHENGMFNAIIYINNHLIKSIGYLSLFTIQNFKIKFEDSSTLFRMEIFCFQ